MHARQLCSNFTAKAALARKCHINILWLVQRVDPNAYQLIGEPARLTDLRMLCCFAAPYPLSAFDLLTLHEPAHCVQADLSMLNHFVLPGSVVRTPSSRLAVQPERVVGCGPRRYHCRVLVQSRRRQALSLSRLCSVNRVVRVSRECGRRMGDTRGHPNPRLRNLDGTGAGVRAHTRRLYSRSVSSL